MKRENVQASMNALPGHRLAPFDSSNRHGFTKTQARFRARLSH
jgi:hypothetical protein